MARLIWQHPLFSNPLRIFFVSCWNFMSHTHTFHNALVFKAAERMTHRCLLIVVKGFSNPKFQTLSHFSCKAGPIAQAPTYLYHFLFYLSCNKILYKSNLREKSLFWLTVQWYSLLSIMMKKQIRATVWYMVVLQPQSKHREWWTLLLSLLSLLYSIQEPMRCYHPKWKCYSPKN